MSYKSDKVISYVIANGGHIKIPKEVLYDEKHILITDVFIIGKIKVLFDNRIFDGDLTSLPDDEILDIILEKIETNQFI